MSPRGDLQSPRSIPASGRNLMYRAGVVSSLVILGVIYQRKHRLVTNTNVKESKSRRGWFVDRQLSGVPVAARREDELQEMGHHSQISVS